MVELIDRAQFPVLERRVGRDGDRPLVYLDSAATSLVPSRVTGAVARFLDTSCANIHRGAHRLAEEATDAYEGAREHVAAFLGVGDPDRLVFTRGATEAMNLAAFGWAAHALAPGDVVAVAEDNHHANIVCWQMLAERRGVELAWVPVGDDGLLDVEAWRRIAERGPKLVALALQSNVLGFRQPSLETVMCEAREAGAHVALDAAQAAGHGPLRFDDLPADFLVVSAHKMMGLTGIGALALSARAAAGMRPVFGGGGMIERVDRDGFATATLPAALEPGTPPLAAAVAWDEALRLIEEVGVGCVAAHTQVLASCAAHELAKIPGVHVLGGGSGLLFESLVSFEVEGIHPHDVSRLLDDTGIAVRAGHHCAQPLHRALGVPASVRASFAGYSNSDDVDAFVAAVECIAGRGSA